MKKPTIESDCPIGQEHWEYLKPTKVGRYSNVDLTGMHFHKWLVLGPEGYHEGKGWYWNCRCECGTEKPVLQRNLLEGKSKSCGCFRKDNINRVRKASTGKHKKAVPI